MLIHLPIKDQSKAQLVELLKNEPTIYAILRGKSEAKSTLYIDLYVIGHKSHFNSANKHMWNITKYVAHQLKMKTCAKGLILKGESIARGFTTGLGTSLEMSDLKLLRPFLFGNYETWIDYEWLV